MIPLENIKNSLESTGKFWIAFTGDSITSTEWVHPNWREIVEYVLKEEITKKFHADWKLSSWGIRCFNFGFDGSTTKDILEKIPDILLVKPDLLIGLMGGNDPTFAVSVEQSVQNVQQIITVLNQNGTKVAWCTSTPAGYGSKKNPEYEPYAKALVSQLQNTNQSQIIDMYTIYQQFPLDKFFTFTSEEIPVEGIKAGDPDVQHPNQLGNAYIAQVILQEVFGIPFDPERYIETTLSGEKYPQY